MKIILEPDKECQSVNRSESLFISFIRRTIQVPSLLTVIVMPVNGERCQMWTCRAKFTRLGTLKRHEKAQRYAPPLLYGI